MARRRGKTEKGGGEEEGERERAKKKIIKSSPERKVK